MKFLVFLAVAVACACADVSHVLKSSDADAQVLRYEADVKPDGEYNYAFETNNGIFQEAQGVLKNVQNENPILEVTGASRHTAPDGSVYNLNYVANENGYQPTGDHLPVAPAIPKEILRALEYIATHPQAEDKNENYQRTAPVPVKPYKPAPGVNKPSKQF